MYGVANLISKHERGAKNWYYTVNSTGKSDSVINSVVVWNFEFVLLLKFLYYTDGYTDRVDRVANRVLT